ncbi:MAG: response regulator transcription factor [Flavobacteriales bacterium]|jgi:DNA-binding NarL/FixJ family response regulator|nr:response regulator transcription factor [Flavobacteriales bacterium]
MKHRIALVDDHHLVRTGLAATVNALGDYQVTLEAGHGAEMIERLGLAQASPQLAIIDLNMPVMDGWDTIAWLSKNRPEILPMALTFEATEEAMLRAVRAGARGFLLKNAKPEVLRLALDSIRLTGYYHNDDLNGVLAGNPDRLTPRERERAELLELITDREMHLLRLVCDEEEFTYDRIAEIMGLHRRTVDNYRIQLFDKFGVRSKTGLVLFALRWNLLD